jgi:glycosyltransferase involved in cell wall biosynthesis
MRKKRKIIKRKTIVKKIIKIVPKHRETIKNLSNIKIDDEITKKIASDIDIDNDKLYKLSGSLSLSDRSKQGEKISIIVACMNRYENLVQAVCSWLPCQEIYEIIILDYGSKIPLEEKKIHKLSEKIKLYRTETQYWHLTRAYNIAAQCATGDIILKMDSDYVIKDGFFDYHKLSYNSFIFGGDGRQFGHLYGLFCIYKKIFFLLNGYNEKIINYGYDDQDMYQRCKYMAGMRPVTTNRKLIYHIPHSNISRVANQPLKTRNKRAYDSQNKLIAKTHIWSDKYEMTPKDVATRII